MKLLLDPRYGKLSLLVDYARIDGSENIPHIKRNVRPTRVFSLNELEFYTIACRVMLHLKTQDEKVA